MNLQEQIQRIQEMMGLIIEAYDPEEVRDKYVNEKNIVSNEQFDKLKMLFPEYQQFIWILKKLESDCFGYNEVHNFVDYFKIFNKKKKMFPIKDLGQIKTCEQTNEFIDKCKETLVTSQEDENLFIKHSEIEELEKNNILYMGIHLGYQVFVVPKYNENIDFNKLYKLYRNILAKCENRTDDNKINFCTVAKEQTFRGYLTNNELVVFHKKGLHNSPIQISAGGECKDKNNDYTLACGKLVPIAQDLASKARDIITNRFEQTKTEYIPKQKDDSEKQIDTITNIEPPNIQRSVNKRIDEQINRIQEMMAKIANEDFSDYGELTNPQKLEKDFQKYITTNEPRGVGKIHQSIGDDLGQMIRTLKQDFGFKKIKYVDQGHFGMAFDVGNNKVLKLTGNENEIRGIRKVLNKDIPGVVKYYDIKHYSDSNVYAVLMDKVKPLSKKEETIYTVIYYEMANHSDSDFWDKYDNYNEVEYDDDEYFHTREGLLEELVDRLESPRPEDELPSFQIDENELVDYIDMYRELLLTLESNNVPTEDLHGGNIGRTDNKLIHFDVMDFPEKN